MPAAMRPAAQTGCAPNMRSHAKGREPNISDCALQCSACKAVQRAFQELPALREMSREGITDITDITVA